MDLVRAEKLVYVNQSLPPSEQIMIPQQLVGTCNPEEVPTSAVSVWGEGFKPIFIFKSHTELDECTKNIPMLRRRWSALANDRDMDTIKQLEQHLSLDVIRGLAGRNLLLVEDSFRNELQELVAKDTVVLSQFQQLENGIININQLEYVSDYVQSFYDNYDEDEYKERNNNGFFAKWVLDPRIIFKITFNTDGVVLISCKSPETLPKPTQLDFGSSKVAFNQIGDSSEYAIELTIKEHGRLIVALAKKLNIIAKIAKVLIIYYLDNFGSIINEQKIKFIELLRETAGSFLTIIDPSVQNQNYAPLGDDFFVGRNDADKALLLKIWYDGNDVRLSVSVATSVLADSLLSYKYGNEIEATELQLKEVKGRRRKDVALKTVKSLSEVGQQTLTITLGGEENLAMFKLTIHIDHDNNLFSITLGSRGTKLKDMEVHYLLDNYQGFHKIANPNLEENDPWLLQGQIKSSGGPFNKFSLWIPK